ncbi:archaellar assembly protein FlaJ [Archaeoglobus veneficus]|uniref:Type II secretion system F domain protein n=1 Tax=Archaeoglobus veneficus (strain DSM 11195 / SNP6) TaxID=693661 RepID=F2KP69_ARCVS|nr:archaellar assembly protein FlaJ [Archaeoglobus veneficus]AEA47473.1 Type II secretion system F domain protein [Archaeoglobus veneficus SNP6]
MEYADLFRIIGISARDYFVKFAAPLVVISIISSLLFYYLLGPLVGNMSFIFLLIPLFGILLALLYPKIVADKKRIEIDQNLHLFITHIGVLATAEVDRVALFEKIAEKKEFEELANQARKIVKLVREWGLSLPEACKFQAKRCPSKIFRDFLERFAYNIDAGQPVEEFLMAEQDVLMTEFETMYFNALKDVDIFKDLFLSMVLSIAFAVVFATILPALTGTDPLFMLLITLVLFAVTETGFLYAMKTRIPNDPLWAKFDTKTESERKLDLYIFIALIGVAVLCVVVALMFLGTIPTTLPIINKPMPLIMQLVLPLTPLIIPGMVSRKIEKILRERDKHYPSFIRSLGAAETAKQTTTTHALKTLQYKDFGALTEKVRNLYKRLNMRISQEYSWRMFMRECETFIIHRFSEMYMDARIKGGVPEKIGNIIAKNVERINALRMHRNQTTTTLIGVLYGITASLAFALYVGVEVIELMANSLQVINMNLPEGVPSASILSLQQYNIPQVNFIIALLLIVHSMLSSVMIKIVDGGHQVNAYFHFVVMLWISALSALATDLGIGSMIKIGELA